MDDAWAKEIGRRIELARKRAKLSRPELANILEVHTNTITGYERGDRAAYKAVGRVAQATNSDLRWLMFGAEYQDPLKRIEGKLDDLLQRLPMGPAVEDGELADAADEYEQALEEAVEQRDAPAAKAALGAPSGGRPGKAP